MPSCHLGSPLFGTRLPICDHEMVFSFENQQRKSKECDVCSANVSPTICDYSDNMNNEYNRIFALICSERSTSNLRMKLMRVLRNINLMYVFYLKGKYVYYSSSEYQINKQPVESEQTESNIQKFF